MSKTSTVRGKSIEAMKAEADAEQERGVKAYEMLENAMNIPELIARFQLETETTIRGLRSELITAVAGCEKRVAALTDEWTQTREAVRLLEQRVESAIHELTQGVREAVNAQRESVTAAQRAEQSAKVFDKLRESQPDFHRMVREQNQTIAKLRDDQTHLREIVDGYGKRLDDFEVVADDYQDTKGEVRSLDIHVKDLRTESLQRRQVSGRGS